jgi:hypothetical protein
MAASAPPDIVTLVYGWLRQRIEADATVMAALAHPDAAGWEWVGHFKIGDQGRSFTGMADLVSRVNADLMAVNAQSDPTVDLVLVQEPLSWSDDDSVAVPWRWLGSRLRIHGPQ